MEITSILKRKKNALITISIALSKCKYNSSNSKIKKCSSMTVINVAALA